MSTLSKLLSSLIQNQSNITEKTIYISSNYLSKHQPIQITGTIAASAINVNNISSNIISTTQLSASIINTDIISANTISIDQISLDILSASSISAATINTNTISANDVIIPANRSLTGTIKTLSGNTINSVNFTDNILYLNKQSGNPLTTNININTGDYLPISGGNVTGTTMFTNGLSTTLLSANSLSLVNPLSAGEITYDNEEYPTIKAALDKLLFKSFAISSYTMSPNTTTMYVGDKLTNLIFNWSYTGTYTELASQSLKLNNTQLINDKTLRTYTYLNIISASTPTTFTFNLFASNTNAESKSQDKVIAAVNYDLYFDTNENASFQSLELDELTQVKKVDGRYDTSQTIPFTTTTAQYIYFAIPIDRYSTIKIKADGFDFNNYSFNCTKVKTFTSTGCNITYNVYRFANTLQGSTECIFTFIR